MSKLLENNKLQNYGYDVLKGEYVDMVEAGIIDPCLVATSAVKNAASIAGLLLTTDCMVANEPEKAPAAPAAPAMGMM